VLKSFSKIAALALLSLAANMTLAEPLKANSDVYVSDSANVWTRSGPGNNYRITGIRHVGDKLKFIRYSDNGKFVLVEDENGQNWMQTNDVQQDPCGKALVDILQKRVDELEYKLANYDTQLSRDYAEASSKLAVLEKENAQLKASDAEKNATIQKLDTQRREYAEKLETRDLDMQMRWWLQGALIALGGAIIGIVFVFIPRPGRKKRERY
jgi:SH3 domain protein